MQTVIIAIYSPIYLLIFHLVSVKRTFHTNFFYFNPLVPRVHKKVTLLTAGLFKYAWPFSGGHQELKGSNQTHYKHRGILIKPYTFPLIRFVVFHNLNTLSDYSTKRSITLKQFVDNSRWIVWVCLPILWGWCLKGLKVTELISRTSKEEEHWKLSKMCSG